MSTVRVSNNGRPPTADATAPRPGEVCSLCGTVLLSPPTPQDLPGRQAEEQLHKLSRAVEQIADAVFITDKQGLIQYVNPAFELMTGYSRSEVLGNTPRIVKSGHHDPDFYYRLWMTILSGRNFRAVITNRKKDGELFYADATITPLKDQAGNVTHFVASWKDITESKHAQDELHRSQERFALAVQGSNDGIWDWDLTRDEVYFSPRWKNMLGYDDHEIFNKSSEWSSRLHPADAEQALKTIQAYLDDLLPNYEVVHRMRHKDGSYRWILSRGVAFRDADGKPYRMAGSHTDITRTKQYEEELRKAMQAAEDANRAKSQFLANVSHEVRTPLAGILGMTQLALETSLSAEQRDYLTTTKVSAEALLSVINDILDFSKIEAGKLELHLDEVALREAVGATLKTLAVRAHSKGLQIAYRVAADVPDLLRGDWSRLRQIVVNLIGNALKFTEKGEVVLRVTREQSVLRHHGETASDEVICHLHFQVRDTGIGIPPDKQRLIFEPFTQADGSTTRRYGGTGLGLSISDKLVQLMGGRLWVESALGEGSTFHFTVPLAHLDDTQPPKPAAAEFAQRRVLVVEDGASERGILTEIFKEWGAAVDAVDSGEAATAAVADARAAGSPYELLLIETMMPNLSSLDFAEQVMAGDLVPAVVLMFTTTERAEVRERCKALPPAGQVVKPINPAELLPAIRTAFAHARGETVLVPSKTEATAKPASRRLHLLVAEDNSVNQKLIRCLLEKEGHSFLLVANGAEAVAAFQRERFDAVLMDVQMPEMDGLQATGRIRAAEGGSERRTPIIAMTAHAMIGDRERCLEAGMDAYLAKPLDARLLSQTLTDWAAKATPVAPATTAAAAEKKLIDPGASLVRVGGDAELLGELIDLFLTDSPGWLDDVRRAVTAGDATKLRRAAHTLKGAAASFGAEETCDAAKRLEDMGRNEQLAGAEVALAELETALTRLRAALPALRATDPDEGDTLMDTQTATAASDSPATQTHTVLVVDDSSMDRQLTGGIVRKLGGWTATFANDGKEALAAMERATPDIVLTDLQMPEMDGLELVQEIRAKYPTIPVILMTAHGSEDIAIQALQKGAASYVPKKSLAQDLPETLDQLMMLAKSTRFQYRVLECLHYQEMRFVLENDTSMIPPLVSFLEEAITKVQMAESSSMILLGVALHEALTNSIFHGNLELSSTLKEANEGEYYRQAEERKKQEPYLGRRIYVNVSLTPKEAVFVVRDDGNGFDPAILPDPTDPTNLERVSGRGMLLIKTFMDRVEHNSRGNEITMVKFRGKKKK